MATPMQDPGSPDPFDSVAQAQDAIENWVESDRSDATLRAAAEEAITRLSTFVYHLDEASVELVEEALIGFQMLEPEDLPNAHLLDFSFHRAMEFSRENLEIAEGRMTDLEHEPKSVREPAEDEVERYTSLLEELEATLDIWEGS